MMTSTLSRRTLLAGAGLLTAVSAVSVASGARAEPGSSDTVLEAEGIRVLRDGTSLRIQDVEDSDRITIHAVDLIAGVTARPVSSELVTVEDQPALRLEYEVVDEDGEPAEGFACTGTVTVGDGGFYDLVLDLTLPEDYEHAGLTQLTRSYHPAEAFEDTSAIPVGTWAEDEHGGIPYQIPLGTVYSTALSDGVTAHELASSNKADWVGRWSFHLPAEQIDGTRYRMVYSGVVGEIGSAVAGGFLSEDTLSIAATTSRPFHLWTAASAQLEFVLTTTHKGTAADVSIQWELHDWDGALVQEGAQTLSDLEGIGLASVRVGTEVPRGIYFLAATATAGDEKAVVRLNLSVLPAWENPLDAEDSMIGMAALFADAGAGYGVGRRDWLNLLERLGVRHIRQVQMLTEEESSGSGILRWAHRGPGQGQVRVDGDYPEGEVDTALREELMEVTLDGAEEANSPWLEWCNEWNMKGGEMGQGTGTLTGATAAEYVHDVLIPMREYMDSRGTSTKLCIMGLAGPDYVWLEKLAEEGGWEITEAVALHPGRGNFTPDYAPDPSTWDTSPEGNYWNYLGGIQKLKETIAELDEQYGTHHKLFLTEVYAPTYANHWWTDDYRVCAENTLLSLALARAEGADTIQWYQLNDGVHWNRDGIDPEDKEFDYGLVMVDGSLKSSGLAFATASEHVGDAEFVRRIEVGPSAAKGHGLLFETPRGQMQMLWSRADGYILNADHDGGERYAMQEPWVDSWPTKSEIRLPADRDVLEIDCLGRETVLENRQGEVRITLDGAPRMYYGLPDPDDEK